MTSTPPDRQAESGPGFARVLDVGRRVVLRYRIDRATSPHGEGTTDALGTVVATDARTVTVMTRRGEDVVARSTVIAAKEVPPPPTRPGRDPRLPGGSP